MKKFFTSLINPKITPAPKGPQKIDPSKILFSIPTLSNDLGPLELFSGKPGSKDFSFHEDEWRQIEFFPMSQLETVKRMLKEYKQFEQAHRGPHGGWSEVYVRRIERIPVLSAAQPVAKLEQILGIKADVAPILYTYRTISGRVINGFSFPIGGKVTLYGYVEGQAIPVLGAIVGNNSDDHRLSETFIKLNQSDGLVLVDWRAQMLLMGVDNSSQIQTWKP